MLKLSQDSISRGPSVLDKEFTEEVKIFNTRFDYFVELVKNSFHQFPQFYASHFEKMKGKMNFIKIPLKEKTIDFEKWENIKNLYFQKSKKFDEISALTDQEEKSKQLNDLCKDFVEHPSFPNKVDPVVEKLLLEISKKLSHLYEKMEIRNKIFDKDENVIKHTLKQFLFRLKKEIPDTAILNELKKSLDIDEKKLEKFETLRKDWYDFILFYRDLECKMKNARITETVIPKLTEFNVDLVKRKENLPEVKDIRAVNLFSELEKDENYKDSLQTSLGFFQNSFVILFENVQKIKDLKKSQDAYYVANVAPIVTEIKNEISAIESRLQTTDGFLSEAIRKRFTENNNKTFDYKKTSDFIELKKNIFASEIDEVNKKLSKLEVPVGSKPISV
jgi:hypothetical protein